MTEENNNPGSDPVQNDPTNNDPKPGNNPAPGNDPEKNENMIPKSRFDQVNQQKKAAEQELEQVANMLVEDIPADYKDIIPDLPPADKIKWIKNATKKGIFSNKPAESPDNVTPGTGKTQVDTSNMNSFDLLSQGFKNNK